jgi:hypothetical protein
MALQMAWCNLTPSPWQYPNTSWRNFAFEPPSTYNFSLFWLFIDTSSLLSHISLVSNPAIR